jgi:hypothetical protein
VDILRQFLDALTVVHLTLEAHLYGVDPFGLQLLDLE